MVEGSQKRHKVGFEDIDLGTYILNYQAEPTIETGSMGQTLIRLVEESVARYFMVQEKSKHEAEMDLAKIIQQSILPRSDSRLQGADVSWFYHPADRIGGDWFFYHESVDEQALYVMMGDVTGHGFSSGLLATSVVSALMATVKSGHETGHQFPNEPDQLMSFIHSVMNGLSINTPLSMSCIVLKWDYHSGIVRWCNSGHTFPLVLVKNPSSDELSVTALAGNGQGTLSKKASDRSVHEMSPGPDAVLLLYTDGLTEAKSPSGMQFSRGLYRNLKSLELDTRRLDHVLEDLADKMKAHLGGQAQADDCCILMIRRTKS